MIAGSAEGQVEIDAVTDQFALGCQVAALQRLMGGQSCEYPLVVFNPLQVTVANTLQGDLRRLHLPIETRQVMALLLFPGQGILDFADSHQDSLSVLIEKFGNHCPGAVSLGAWSVLNDFGIHASAFGGHSYGE